MLFVCVHIVSATVQYQITDLGTLGGSSSRATAINSNGQVVGYSWIDGDTKQQAFLYSNGSMQNLDWQYGSVYSQANGINSNGQVVGKFFRDGYWHAFLYQNGSMNYLYPVPGVLTDSNGINDSGQIITGSGRAVLYTSVREWNPLEPLGNRSSTAYGINNSGQVVGDADFCGGSRAFLYSNGSMRDLGALGGAFSRAFAINDDGQVVGWAYTSDNTMSHAFLYSNGSILGLNTETDVESQAYGINALGQVVGFISRYRNEEGHRAFLYRNGVMNDLNNFINPSSGWTLRDATAINDIGQITGYGINALGQEHAFLLTPIPEPATLGLLCLGFLMLKRRS